VFAFLYRHNQFLIRLLWTPTRVTMRYRRAILLTEVLLFNVFFLIYGISRPVVQYYARLQHEVIILLYFVIG